MLLPPPPRHKECPLEVCEAEGRAKSIRTKGCYYGEPSLEKKLTLVVNLSSSEKKFRMHNVHLLHKRDEGWVGVVGREL